MARRGDDFRGLSRRDERGAKDHHRDHRRLNRRIHDGLKTPGGLGAAMLVAAGAMVALPVLVYGVVAVALLVWACYRRAVQRAHLPVRMPLEWGRRDYNDPLPTRRRVATARGVFFLGNSTDPDTRDQELHLSAGDMLTHFLLFGTTGAGKSEALLSLGWNSLAMGSGLTFIDPKGTNKLPLQVWSMARMVGRDDDFLLINYSTGNRTIKPYSADRVSNTSNPFSHGTADFLSDIMNSLIPSSEGDNAIFSERALSLMKTLMIGLVEMRDQGRVNLSVRTIRDWMTIERCMEIMNDEALSDTARSSMRAYLNSVAGFNPKKSASEQGEDTLKQFGYAQAYFTRALSSLTDTYGHVYGSLMGEVDYQDVVFNRRILTVVLPSMEKAPPELKALAKVVLAALRSALATGLGSRFEGGYDEMIESLPSASSLPNLFVLDEYGYIATEGFAVTAAQARGLGASCVFAGQDFAGFKRGSETEAEQILANTKVKAIMALEDTQATWEVVQKLGGEVPITVSQGYQIRDDDPLGAYRDSQQANVERRNRVDILDLRDQIEGEFHLFHKGSMVRGRVFHADPDIRSAPMHIHRMLEVDRPSSEELSRHYGPIRDLSRAFRRTLSELVQQKRRSVTETPVRAVDGDDRMDAVAELLRVPDMARHVTRREQALVAVLMKYGGYDADVDGAAEDRTEAVASGEGARPPAEDAGPATPASGSGGEEAVPGVPISSGLGLSLDDDNDDDEDFEPDEEEDEALEGTTPLPSGAQGMSLEEAARREREAAAPSSEVDAAEGTASSGSPPSASQSAKEQPHQAAPVRTAVRAQMREVRAMHDLFGDGDGGLEATVDKRLTDAAEYPQPPTPEPDQRQQRRVLSSLQALRQKSAKYRGDGRTASDGREGED